MDETETCQHCQGQSFEARQMGPHLGIYCSDCGKLHCWEKQTPIDDPDFIMPFGKHAHTPLRKLPTDYLDWGTKNLTGSMQERFKLALEQRYKDFGRAMFIVCEALPKDDKGSVSLKAAVEAFAAKHRIDVGRVHQYLVLYHDYQPRPDWHTITANYITGLIKVSSFGSE